MKRLAGIALTAVVALILSASAQAQDTDRPKTYPLVAVAIPKGPNDPSLGVFRQRVIDIAQKKDEAALERLLARDFFWERDFGSGFDELKSPLVNLSLAIGLGGDTDQGWRLLAAFAQATPGPHDERENVFCGPPAPQYNVDAFEKTLEATKSDAFEWSYPVRQDVVVRDKGEDGAKEIARPGAHFIYTDLAARPQQFDPENDWTPVITHDGKRGFVAPGMLLTLLDPRLCYVKRGGAWLIAGYVGGGD